MTLPDPPIAPAGASGPEVPYSALRDIAATRHRRSAAVATALLLVLGPMGFHRIYLRRYASAMLMAVLFGFGLGGLLGMGQHTTTLFGWPLPATSLSLWAASLWGMIDLVRMPTLVAQANARGERSATGPQGGAERSG